MLHPLVNALDDVGLTQSQLAAMVTALRRRRSNGQVLRLTQSTISRICSFRRRASPDVAEAIVDALRGRVSISAAEIVFAKQPAVAQKPKTQKPRAHRAA